MSVESKLSVTKVVTEAIVVAFTVVIGLLAWNCYPVEVVKMAVQFQVLAVSTLLGLSIWQVIQDTSKLDVGQFKEIYKPDYIISLICFSILFYMCSRGDNKETYSAVLTWLIAGIGIIVIAIIAALKGNAIATDICDDEDEA